MSPLNRGPLAGMRMPPAGAGMRPPMPRFGRTPPGGPLPLPPGPMGRPGPLPPPPVNNMYGPRRRPGPPGPLGPPGPGPLMARPGPPGPPCPPMFPHRVRPMPPMPPMHHMPGPMGPPPRGPMMRPGLRGMLPPHALPMHMRPRFPPHNNGNKGKVSTAKKAKIEELELKKPWMTDEIRTEIQKKNRLYAKAKKNKDAKEWEEFKDLRNKVTRMIRDAKNEYLARNPDQAHLYENDEELVELNDEDFNELYLDSDDESNHLYCEMCDREFISEDKLEKHVLEHEVCNVDGCTFTAHPKIVEKHISMQHYTGLYQRMKNCMSEEDIEKWIAERKRRYPTAANMSRHEAMQLEKEERGEVIESQSKKTYNNPRRKKFSRKNRKRKHDKKHLQPKNHTSDLLLPETYRGLLPFGGTAMLEKEECCDDPDENVTKTTTNEEVCADDRDEDETCHGEPEEFKVSDDEQSSVQKSPSTKTKDSPISNQGLSLVADYGSDSDEPPEEVPCKVSRLTVDEMPPQAGEQIKVAELASSAEPESLKSEKKPQFNKFKSNAQSKNSKKPNASEKKRERSSNTVSPQINNKRLRLLNKLLARSIQHERNAIFQCIKFIANNNFFDEQES